MNKWNNNFAQTKSLIGFSEVNVPYSNIFVYAEEHSKFMNKINKFTCTFIST